jgi:glycosyltransferase involved in cell wall biosynthesis
MLHKKLLLLSTYPIKSPQHGGQKRTRAIYEAYKDSFAEVRHSAVFFRGFYTDYDEDDIPLGSMGEQLVMQSPLTGDIVCGEAIHKDPAVKQKMTKLLLELKPDIIHIEQPFPYLGLRPLLEELNLKPKLVFGSQNIEAPMKREILESANVPTKEINDAVHIISELDRELSKNSDLVVACTESDLNEHTKMGAQNVVLAPNGIAPITTSNSAKDYWRKQFKRLGVKRTVLFVGSAHPPNWTGFLQMVGKGLGFVPADTRIVIAGSIADYFEREIKPEALNIEDATFWLRAYSAGRLSEERLGSLIEQCNIMLLPITEGGGSNLKTAEAILANKKVIATNHALRSFEWFKDFPNVWVADNRKDFQKSIQEALQAPFNNRTAEQTRLAQRVTWDNCLAEMVKSVSKL